MFHPQTTEIQPFKVDCFFMKMLKSQQYDVIIYDISADFGILLDTWNSLVRSYPCAQFHHDMPINNGINCICFVYLWITDRGLRIMTSLILYKSFSYLSYNFDGLSLCKISFISPLTTKIQGRRMPPPPPNVNMSKKRSPKRKHVKKAQSWRKLRTYVA